MMNCNMSKDELMKVITKASFAMDDVKLYLDTHPNCQEALEYYKEAKKMREKAWKMYTSMYGPLSSYEVDSDDCWNWNVAPMPWEGGKC